ncbi:LiaI-LiaF-like domain-containing protein [Salipaludibacillus sp. HK11]|uniref:LiaI-LiaF-like domain-containing protein n=1 Tax=Salipaludibacillus sp. HK11 TaxID=3394320 RepID=UPI0039FD6CC5
MKSNQTLPGVILVIIGIYFLSQQFDFTLPYSDILLKWPTILLLVGLVLSWQGFSNRDEHKMFSGVILLGFGALFHGIHTFQYWTYQWPYFTLIISFAFFLKYFVNKRDGATPGLVLFVISIIALFFTSITGWINSIHSGLDSFWPIILILIGIYLLVFRKK